MIIAFLDESGKPSIKELPFIVSAVIVDDESVLAECESQIAGVKVKYGFPAGLEIHSKDLFHPPSPTYKSMTIDQIDAFVCDLIEAVSNLNVRIISSAVQRGNVNPALVRGSNQSVRREILSRAYELLIERILKIVNRRQTDWLLMIHDFVNVQNSSGHSADESEINDTLELALSNGAYIRNNPARFRTFTPFLFADSSKYGCLQIADLASYLVRRAGLTNVYGVTSDKKKFDYKKYFDLLWKKFDTSPSGQISGWGIKVWTLNIS